ncbi:MAG: glycosyltransferase family 4 protein [Gemmatimonadales bacterium]|nr:glycosyltransferase family 4 protein [Gemmatimonadales bacterium]
MPSKPYSSSHEVTQGGLRLLVANWMDPWNPKAGGAEKHFYELFTRLARRGHSVTLIASGFEGGEPVVERDGITVHRVGTRHTFAIPAVLLARRLLAEWPFSLFIEDLNKVPLYADLWSPIPTFVLVHHIWGRAAFSAAGFPVAALTWLSEALIPRLYRKARFIAVSESTRTDLVIRGIPRHRVAVIPNAAPPPAAPATESGKDPVPLFVYLGRLQRYKRVDLLMQAAVELAREGREFKMVIAGSGPEEEALQRLASELGVATRVEFPGFVPEEDKPGLFRRAWANVLMSEKEGWGLTVLEAAVESTCSVVAAAPGLWDAVVPGETGLWVPYGETRSLAEALRRLMDAPAEVERLGRNALARARAWDWDQAADRLERALREAIPPGAP